jgi:hypothetical protein
VGVSGRRSLLLRAAAFPSACAAQGAAAPLGRPIALQAPPGARLEPLGGLVLDDAALGFGGLSGLHLSADLQVTAVSDLARWMTARLALREDGRPAGLEGLRTGPLRDGAGRPLPRGYSGDSEALARLPDGTWLVGFERWHRIRAYRSLDGPGAYVEAPRGLERAPFNGGVESLAVLADGRWLLVAELFAVPAAAAAAAAAAGARPLRQAWLGRPGGWATLAYRPAEGMDPVDAAPLPDGGALVLERGFSVLGGFAGRVVRLTPTALDRARDGTVLEGEELLRLDPPLPSDNFEGIAAARVGGRALVAIVSDDNENPLQRTLLLLFALSDD